MVYITTNESFPYGMAAVNRIICLAKAFNEAGVKCRILIYTRSNTNSLLPGRGEFDGANYEFVGGSSKRANGFILGKLQAIILKIMLFVYFYKNLRKDDIVYGYINRQNFLVQGLIYLIHLRKAFYIKELCEYPFGTAAESRKTIKGRKYEIKYLFPIYDGIVAISDALVDFAKGITSPKCIISKVPILVDFNRFNIPDTSKKTEIPYIFHSGTLYEQKDGILGMIEAFGKAINRQKLRINFVLTGNKEKSPHRAEIDKLIDKYKISDYIHFTGYLSKEELNDKLSKASLVIINKYPTQQNKYNFSTKLGEYMAAGKPIIITQVGEAMNWLKDGETAYIIPPNNSESLVNAIIKAFSNEDERLMIGDNARAFCKQYFDYHSNTLILKNMVDRMIHEIN